MLQTVFPLTKVAHCKLLFNRDQYVSCHINVSDLPERLAAIAVDGKFYSFFKVLPKAQKALEVVAKLTHKGDEIAVTVSKRGYVLWVYEPDSKLASSKRSPLHLKLRGSAPCTIIYERDRFQPCYLKVADMSQKLAGIKYQANLYSLFRRENEAQGTLEIAAKLTTRNDEVVLIPAQVGYSIFVLESAASLA
ncbi:MAG: hypothetical protein AAFY67_04515 [Cyanobacteria bacterium J06642_9]